MIKWLELTAVRLSSDNPQSVSAETQSDSSDAATTVVPSSDS